MWKPYFKKKHTSFSNIQTDTMGKEKTIPIALQNELVINLHERYFTALTALALNLTLQDKEADDLVAITLLQNMPLVSRPFAPT